MRRDLAEANKRTSAMSAGGGLGALGDMEGSQEVEAASLIFPHGDRNRVLAPGRLAHDALAGHRSNFLDLEVARRTTLGVTD